MDPVGSAVAGALEARRFAERFQRNWTDAVALLPVVGELSLEAGEQAPLIPFANERIGGAWEAESGLREGLRRKIGP